MATDILFYHDPATLVHKLMVNHNLHYSYTSVSPITSIKYLLFVAMKFLTQIWTIPLHVKKLLLCLFLAMVGCKLIYETLPVATSPRMMSPIDEELTIVANLKMQLGIFYTLSEEESERRQIIRKKYLALFKADDCVCDMQRYWNNQFGCKLVYAFVVGILEEGPTLHQNAEPLVVEPTDLKLYGDIVLEEDVAYLNIKDNMDYGKSLTWFKYGASIAKELKIDYIGKIDSDACLNTG